MAHSHHRQYYQYMNYQFIECDTCAAKPGMPTLCRGCLHNRTVIDRLNTKKQTERLSLDYDIQVWMLDATKKINEIIDQVNSIKSS